MSAATWRRENFTRDADGGYSFVYKQPETKEEERRCQEALEALPGRSDWR